MRAVVYTPRGHDPGENALLQAPRIVIGHCPNCRRALVVLNAREIWPYIECAAPCDWSGPTTALENRARYEDRGQVIDTYRPDVTA